MACPTCDHTTHRIDTTEEAGPLYWCPRCGTLHRPMKGNHPPDTSAPKLVERCRKLEGMAREAVTQDVPIEARHLAEAMHRLGITEAIHPPGDRLRPAAAEVPRGGVTTDT